MKLCEAYSVGKASKNDVSKNSDHEPAKGNDEQIFINISSVKTNVWNTSPIKMTLAHYGR